MREYLFCDAYSGIISAFVLSILTFAVAACLLMFIGSVIDDIRTARMKRRERRCDRSAMQLEGIRRYQEQKQRDAENERLSMR